LVLSRVVTEESLTAERERYLKPYSHTINAFINSEGGLLLVGVTDKGYVKGIQLTKYQKIHQRMAIVDMFNRFKPHVPKGTYDIRFIPVIRPDDSFDEYIADPEKPSEVDVFRKHLLRSRDPCWCLLEANARKEFAILPPTYVVEIRVKKGTRVHKNEAGQVFYRITMQYYLYF
jgi:hypothetical protein